MEKTLEEVKLLKFKKFYTKWLSGGMNRKLSLAISIVGDPIIIFLDKPTTV